MLTASKAIGPGHLRESPTIRLQGITKWFFKNGKRFTAIDNLSADLSQSSFTALVGPSGCGKSTLFNMIAGFASPDLGEVIYNGSQVEGPNVGIGYMTQKDALLPWRSVLSNVMLPLYLQNVPKNKARERAQHMLHRVGLNGFGEHLPRELSGGMQKRAALARMLVFNPPTLLMDEPFGNVDVQLKLQLQRVLMSLWEAERTTVVFVTHDLEEAISLSDRVIVMSRRPGKIKAIVPIDLPRPRDPIAIRFESSFQQLHHRLWDLCDTTSE